MNTLRDQLILRVSREIGRHGYQHRSGSSSFYSLESFGRSSFHLNIDDHADRLEVMGEVAIRFDDLENLVNRDNDLLSPLERSETVSLIAELGRMETGIAKVWTITSFDDIRAVCIDIVDTFRRVGLPYIEKYSNLDAALEILARNEPQHPLLQEPNLTERAKRAVAVAFIMGDGQKFNQLVENKAEALQRRSHLDLQYFKDFLAILDI